MAAKRSRAGSTSSRPRGGSRSTTRLTPRRSYSAISASSPWAPKMVIGIGWRPASASFWLAAAIRGVHPVRWALCLAALAFTGVVAAGLQTLFDGQPPRWPTFGVRLSMRPDGRANTTEVRGTVSLALSLVETMLEACEAQHIDDPCVQARSVFVDTSSVGPIDFGITDEEQDHLLATGRKAAEEFLGQWDFDAWLRKCRGVGS